MARAERLSGLDATEPLFAHRHAGASVPDDDRIACAEWGNHWQMIDIGLLLRARGFRAELQVQRAMRNFGVVLDWGLAL